MTTLQNLRDIPTTPNSPATVYERTLHSPSPAVSLAEWSEADITSSIESLPREGFRLNTHSSSQLAHSMDLRPASRNSSITPRSSMYTTDSHHGFVMPSLPRITQGDDEPVVGFLKVAICGVKGALLLNALTSSLRCTRKDVRDDGVDAYTCSSSPTERGNITILDANFVPLEISQWLEVQLQRDSPVDLVVYSLSSEGPLNEDLAAMEEIQKLAELVVAIAICGNEPNKAVETERMLIESCVNNFRNRVWLVNTELLRNWDMTASEVESSTYKSFVPTLDNSELGALISALCSSSGRIRAHARMLQSRWFQSQLVVILPGPAGALTQRFNLRRKAFGSIGNLDPLNIANISSIPRIISAIGTGLIRATLAALGVSTLTSRILLRSNQVPPACKRHSIFDLENLHR